MFEFAAGIARHVGRLGDHAALSLHSRVHKHDFLFAVRRSLRYQNESPPGSIAARPVAKTLAPRAAVAIVVCCASVVEEMTARKRRRAKHGAEVSGMRNDDAGNSRT